MTYKPKVGDRIRVTVEGEITWVDDQGGLKVPSVDIACCPHGTHVTLHQGIRWEIIPGPAPEGRYS